MKKGKKLIDLISLIHKGKKSKAIGISLKEFKPYTHEVQLYLNSVKNYYTIKYDRLYFKEV